MICSHCLPGSASTHNGFDTALIQTLTALALELNTGKYALFETASELDQGTMSTYTKTFAVTEQQCPAAFELELVSHSLIKRLKVVGTLYRQDGPSVNYSHSYLFTRGRILRAAR